MKPVFAYSCVQQQVWDWFWTPQTTWSFERTRIVAATRWSNTRPAEKTEKRWKSWWRGVRSCRRRKWWRLEWHRRVSRIEIWRITFRYPRHGRWWLRGFWWRNGIMTKTHTLRRVQCWRHSRSLRADVTRALCVGWHGAKVGMGQRLAWGKGWNGAKVGMGQRLAWGAWPRANACLQHCSLQLCLLDLNSDWTPIFVKSDAVCPCTGTCLAILCYITWPAKHCTVF